jgi:hypothetical protein
MARIIDAPPAHPTRHLLLAGLAIAAATAVGYVGVTAMAQPNPAPVSERGAAEHGAKPRDIVIWRDETGAIYRATVNGGRFGDFRRRQQEILEAARSESRNRTASEIAAAVKPVFAEMTARVPAYANWYFGYTTKYELMAHAVVPAIDYLTSSLIGGPPEQPSLVRAMGIHMAAYLEEQYADRVVRPRAAEIRLQAAFQNSYDGLRARWTQIVAEQRGAMRAYIQQQAGSAQRLSDDQAAAPDLKLDWDGSKAGGQVMHKDRTIEESFRRGLLSLTLTTPKSVKAQNDPDIADNTVAGSDEISHVIVNLFDKVVGPVVSQMGDLAIGISAGSAASGTTLGMGFAGIGPIGLGMGTGPTGVATGLATAIPIGGAIGLATTVVAEMLSNRLEAALGRGEFEENVRQTIDATENSVETKMISVLHGHIAAAYADAINPVAMK